MGAIKAICWDVGGVLLTNGWDHEERAAVLGHFSLDPAEYEGRHELANDAWEKGFMTVEQFLARTVFYEPRSFTPVEFFAQMKAQSKPLPSGAMRILRELRASNQCRLAALNNEARELNEYRIERFELDHFFQVFLSSCYLGLRKPDPEMFKFALGVLQARPEEVAFVDDRLGNCEAAAGLGINAICYSDEARLAQELATLGVLVTSSL